MLKRNYRGLLVLAAAAVLTFISVSPTNADYYYGHHPYYNHGGYYHDYGYYHHPYHHGYWGHRDGVRVWINL